MNIEISKTEHVKNNNMTKILVSFPTETLNKINDLAKESGMNRSAMINYAVKFYIDYKQSMDMMPRMLEALKKIDNKDINHKGK